MTRPPVPRFSPTLLALLIALLPSCSAHLTTSPIQAPARILLEQAPLWNVAVAWDENEEHLIVLDPVTHQLLVLSLEGRVVRRVDLDPLGDFDFTHPLKLLATGNGYLLGDRRILLRLDRDLEARGLVDVFAELEGAGIAGGFLGDFVASGGNLYGYADFRRAGETDRIWHRGFVRIDLERGRLVVLHELELADGEYLNYYYYDRRPYLATVGGRVYVLRYGAPPAIHRARRAALRKAHAVDARAHQLFAIGGWRDQLLVLFSPSEDEEAGPRGSDWILRAIDPKTGGVKGEYPLSIAGPRLHVVPGDRYWAFLEQAPDPASEGARRIYSVRFEPAERFAGGPGDRDRW